MHLPCLRILTVEDELIIAKDLAETLEEMGHHVIGNARTATQALDLLQNQGPDLILLDIQLAEKTSGIDLAQHLQKHHNEIPYIFLTSFADPATLQNAIQTMPYGYLVKPFQPENLHAAILLAHQRHIQRPQEEQTSHDHIFVRYNGRLQKITLKDILWIQAEGNYTEIHLPKDKYLVRSTLKEVLDTLPTADFVRVHRSYVVQICHVLSKQGNQIRIAGKQQRIPIGRNYQACLQQRIPAL
ncbi:MAG: LytR/AlgR family response regulator transcription factor [Bernardetiaceae bacterium]